MNSVHKIGRYEVKEHLSQGGMADVFLVYDPRFGVERAIKLLPSQLTSQTALRQRFEFEVKTIARLEHPAVVPVYDVGEHNGQPFLVMRYMRGGSLRERLGQLSSIEIIEIFTRLANAIDKAHQLGIIHRDIKPDNILLDEDGRAYLADFGIARASEATNPVTAGVGTPNYMSPEQNRGGKVDGRSDIYSLGATLFEIWTGTLPKKPNSSKQRFLQKLTPNLLQYNPNLPAAYQTIINKAMAIAPNDRYSTAREMADEIKAVINSSSKEQDKQSPKIQQTRPRLKSFWEKPLWQWVGAVSVIITIIVGILDILDTVSQVESPSQLVQPKKTVETPSAVSEAITPTLKTKIFVPDVNVALGITVTRPADGMVMVGVPGGTFLMGSDPSQDSNTLKDEQPQHSVTLTGYWIDQTEVSNAQFANFVTETNHKTTAETEGGGWVMVGDSLEFIEGATWQQIRGLESNILGMENHPVVLVSWYDANAYCHWVGGQLPTEAQWEYAARGKTSYLFPWGNSFDGTRLNFCDRNCPTSQAEVSINDRYKRTAPISSYSPVGDSWVGASDMTGNVWEWSQDWYDENYYDVAAADEPGGPMAGKTKALRGGSWRNGLLLIRAAYRNDSEPNGVFDDLGFRCVVTSGR